MLYDGKYPNARTAHEEPRTTVPGVFPLLKCRKVGVFVSPTPEVITLDLMCSTLSPSHSCLHQPCADQYEIRVCIRRSPSPSSKIRFGCIADAVSRSRAKSKQR